MEKYKSIGCEALYRRRKTAFFCSRNVPKAMPVVIEEWVNVISAEDYCVICGAQSPMEKYAFSLILQYKVPAILMLATAMPDTWSEEIQAALDENRLLVMTHCDENVHRVTAKSASDRNRLMLDAADNVVVGYCDEDGNIARMLNGYDDVVYLLDDNDSGVAPYIDYYEAHYEAFSNDVDRDRKQWEGCMPEARGVLSFSFLGEGKDRFMKISQQSVCKQDALEQSAIRMDLKELTDLCNIFPYVYDCLERKEPIKEEFFVESASGDITFTADYSDSYGILIIKQTKIFKSAVIRNEAIYLGAESLVSFHDMLKEAASHF